MSSALQRTVVCGSCVRVLGCLKLLHSGCIRGYGQTLDRECNNRLATITTGLQLVKSLKGSKTQDRGLLDYPGEDPNQRRVLEMVYTIFDTSGKVGNGKSVPSVGNWVDPGLMGLMQGYTALHNTYLLLW
jgi:hypothetical protein